MTQTAARYQFAPAFASRPTGAVDIPRWDLAAGLDWDRPGRLSDPPVTVARRAVVDVDVVIVGHQARAAVLACLDSLDEAANGAVVSATVVDNGSEDGTVEAVVGRHDGTRVITMGFDTGLATGANAGMARGLGRYVLVLDSHATLIPGSLRTLVEFADRNPCTGAIAPLVLDAAARPAGPRPLRAPYEVDRVPTTAVLVPRVVHAATAGFDEDLPAFWAGADWCRRIRSAGYSVWCVPQSLAVHHAPRPAADLAAVRSYHDGAYRYWLKHDAPSVWHPRRWTDAAWLCGSAFVDRIRASLRPSPDGPAGSQQPRHPRRHG